MNDEGIKNLIVAIFEQSVKDLSNPNEKEDAEKFLNSKWCNSMLEGMGMNFTGKTILSKAATLNAKEDTKW